MTIGELARSAGVRTSTLRFYERRGLLRAAGRTTGGYRQFTADDVARVRFCAAPRSSASGSPSSR